MRTSRSADAVTSRLPSGEYSAEDTQSLKPRITSSRAPVLAFQIPTVSSSDPVTIRLPSGEYIAESTSL